MTQINHKKSISRNLIYILITAFILSASLNIILLSGHLNKGKNIGLDKKYEKLKLDDHVLDLIGDRPLRVKLDFYPAINIDEFRTFAQNHGLKPVIFFGYNFINKKENDERLIKKYNFQEGDYITDARQQLGPFLKNYENESFILGHYTVVIENERIINEEIITATTSNLTKSKIKELLNNGQVRAMELGIIEY